MFHWLSTRRRLSIVERKTCPAVLGECNSSVGRYRRAEHDVVARWT